MDLSRFTLSDWAGLASGAVSETLVAAAVSAVATLALVAGFAPRIGLVGRGGDRRSEDGACDFVVHGTTVRPITAPAR